MQIKATHVAAGTGVVFALGQLVVAYQTKDINLASVALTTIGMAFLPSLTAIGKSLITKLLEKVFGPTPGPPPPAPVADPDPVPPAPRSPLGQYRMPDGFDTWDSPPAPPKNL